MPGLSYTYIESPEDLEAFAVALAGQPTAPVAVDTETTGLDPLAEGSRLLLLQIGLAAGSVYVINAAKLDLAPLRGILDNGTTTIEEDGSYTYTGRLCILQNAKFDWKFLKVHAGIDLRRVYDTQLAELILVAGLYEQVRERRGKASLKALVAKYVGEQMDKTARLSFVGFQGNEFPQELLDYAAEDVPHLWTIMEAQKQEITKAGLAETARLEFGVVPFVGAMELAGISINAPDYRKVIAESRLELAKAERHCLSLVIAAGGYVDLFGESHLNLASSDQVKQVLKNQFGIETKSTEEKHLKRLGDHPFVKAILNHRDWDTQVNNFGEKIMERLHPVTGRIHAEFQQMGGDAGRFTCEKPNLQQIPADPKYRKLFIPRPGNVFVDADWQAMEMRILAKISGDQVLLRAFLEGRDLHSHTAAEMYGLDYDQVVADHKSGGSKERQRAKCFHPDTEVLTRSGWKRILDLTEGEEVVQAIPKDSRRVDLEWAVPMEVFSTKHPSGELIHFESEGVDLRVTPDHRMVSWNRPGGLFVDEAGNLPNTRYFCNAGDLGVGEGVQVDEFLLRLAVATQADGSFSRKSIRFGFSKMRKAERLQTLLDAAKFDYTFSVLNNGVATFRVSGPCSQRVKDLLDDKKLPWCWLDLSKGCREIVLDEASFWDAHVQDDWQMYGYYTSERQNADVLQALAAITNQKTAIREKTVCRRPAYTVSVKKQNSTQVRNCKRSVVPFEEEVACLSVPSSFVLVRDRGKTLITGQTLNFALCYGMGVPSLAEELKCNNQDAQEAMDRYFGAFPGVAAYLKRQDKEGPRTLEVRTLGGRRRVFNAPRDKREVGSIQRKSRNTPTQGTNGDAVKRAMTLLGNRLEWAAIFPGIVLTVHDEILVECPTDRAEETAQIVKDSMNQAAAYYLCEVPIITEVKIAPFWLK